MENCSIFGYEKIISFSFKEQVSSKRLVMQIGPKVELKLTIKAIVDKRNEFKNHMLIH